MSRNILETIMGAAVLLVAGLFLTFAYEHSSVKSGSGYTINALFDNVSGLSVGSDVRIGGIKVGVIDGMDLDPETFRATLHLFIEERYALPKDTVAAIVSSGLLGEKFVNLEPGGDDEMMQPGDAIRFTQSSVNIEDIIGRFVFSGGGVEGEEGAAPAEKGGKGIE
ncbi:MAG: outer membrane lipid asymmetry maintenance protein MlaD [Ketobacter sp.]|nr:outer membrane lipid asymmetry maintenance protein MlaD [Ketobacter sp.]